MIHLDALSSSSEVSPLPTIGQPPPFESSKTPRSPNEDLPKQALKQAPKQTPKHTFSALQAVLFRWIRRAKGIFQNHHLPRVASRVCQTYIATDQPDLQSACRNILQMRLELNPLQLRRFLHTPIGDTLIAGLDRFFQSVDWHTTLIKMASEPDGISLFSVLRHLPKSLRVNSDRVLSTAQQIDHLIRTTENLIAQIEQGVHQHPQQGSVPNFSQWPDLRKPGAFEVEGHCFHLQGQWDSTAIHRAGLTHDSIWGQQRSDRQLKVWLYRPFPWPPHPVPVVVLSHGLASAPDDLVEYAHHLASHGYAIALPQHPGSDSTYMQQMLSGQTSDVFDPTEFIHRPLDISDVLDELERRNGRDYGHHLNLKQVGLMGVSFGAYTALVVAGATLDLAQLATSCQPHSPEPNLSLLLQCRALNLPLTSFRLREPRIAAVVTLDAIGSQALQLETLHQMPCPVMMLAGSRDMTAPLALEQLRLFQHLNPSQRYLGIMRGKSHLRNWHKWQTSFQLDLRIFPQSSSPQSTLFDTYIQSLTLAFFEVYLDAKSTASVYLQTAYGQYLSQPPFDLLFLKDWDIDGGDSHVFDHELAPTHSVATHKRAH